MPRFYCPVPLASEALLELPAGAARHVQVLRLQPGDSITLFNGRYGMACDAGTPGHSLGGEFEATITHMGRSDVQVRVGAHSAIERESAATVHLAVGMPANDRMDWLVEKATELGVASIQPLMTERSVLRLSGERADKKIAHWQSVAVASCEQCGGNRVPLVHGVKTLTAWLQSLPVPGADVRCLLSLAAGSSPLHTLAAHGGARHTTFLSGPEGGLGAAEEAAAMARGFAPVSLGPRVLRAETAALTALARLLV
ncbi:16S rRNA (uracil(1498)-N(3))-methyltransferase [Rhodoferax sp. AJA081-3]|uniref:16S rRNA (uracil(1498)-N(3))-methyltransferase n=1 Tax=Rhodoferax sp. AJA081-3 TaxID=2752316 RepID=UPI001ADFD069|nr:16S rRNA (uracil(1498)-N(3))-methyltransferase [Rhodoferax sp. AJA081-3]QTN26677.1 16S rRNA (uracil(1498)-N(3))-methyltransferase [Rhodoferax sp. AJA081-3]